MAMILFAPAEQRANGWCSVPLVGCMNGWRRPGAQHDQDINAGIDLEPLVIGKIPSATPERIGKISPVGHETGQQDNSGQKPLDREERQLAHICVHFWIAAAP